MPTVGIDVAVNLQTGKLEQEMKKVNKTFDVNKRIAGWERILEINKELHRLTGDKKYLSNISSAKDEIRILKEAKTLIGDKGNAEKNFGHSVDKANNSLSSQGGVVQNLVSLFRKYFSLFAVADLGSKIAKTTGYFEQQQVALEGILGSAALAQKSIDKIKSIALESPFQTKDLVTYTKQLSVYGLEADELVDTMKNLADISAGLGVDMNRIILAYGQVKSASVLRGQELRQFTEAGIPLVQELANKFTQLNGTLVTTGDVFRLISERKVSFEMVADVLKDMTAEGGKFHDMQKNLTNTMYGQIEKLKDVWTISMNDLGNKFKLPFDTAIKLVQSLIEHATGLMVAFNTAFAITGLNAFLRNTLRIGANFRLAKIEAMKFVQTVQDVRVQTKLASMEAGKFRIAWSAVGTAMSSAVKLLTNPVWLAAFSAAVGLIFDAVNNAVAFRKELEEIDKSFNKTASSQKKGLDEIIGRLSVATVGTKEYNDAISTLKTNYGSYVSSSTIDYLTKEQEAVRLTGQAWADMAESIKRAIDAKTEYEKNNARAEKSGEGAENRATKSRWYLGGQSLMKNQLTAFNNGLLQQYQNGKQVDLVDKFKGEAGENANRAIEVALEEFIESKSLTKEEFKAILENAAKQYAPERKNELAAISNSLFGVFAQGKEWKEYEASVTAARNTNYYKNNKAFNEARVNAANAKEGKWKGTIEEYGKVNEESKSYDPFAWNKQEDEKYIDAAKGRMDELFGAITESMQGDKFDEAKDELKKAFESGFDEEKTKRVADAMHGIAEALDTSADGASEMKSAIEDLTGIFVKFAGTKSGVAAQISSNIEESFKGGANVSAKKKDFFNRYNPTDQNYNALRSQIVSEYQRLENEVKSHPNPTGEWKKVVDDYKEQMSWLKELASTRYYDVDLNKKKGGGIGSIRGEESEFITLFQNAFKTYRSATQAQGEAMGQAFMKGDPKMVEKFSQFFNGIEGAQLKDKSGNEVKFGGKTIKELFDGKYLGNGILDFEKGMEALIEALKKGTSAEKRYATHLESTWNQLLNKSIVDDWIKQMNKSIDDLGKTFKRSSEQIDAYRSLMKNGTVDSLGKYVGATREDALTPDSTRQLGNMRAMANKYNQMVIENNKKGTLKTDEGIEIQLPQIQIGNLDTVEDVYAAIEQLTNFKSLNNGSFGASEYGKAGQTLETMLQEYLKTIISELKSISSETYTGADLADVIANAQTKVKTAYDISRSAEEINKKYGGDQGAAMKGRMDAVYEGVKTTFEQFLKTNDFEALSKATRFFKKPDGTDSSVAVWGSAGIDIGKMRMKFNSIIEKIDDDMLANELRKKFQDLELKVLEFNAKGGDLGTIHDNLQLYRNAHQMAVDKYAATVSKGEELGGEYNEETNSFIIDPSLPQEVQEELAACNEELAAMGKNGVKFEDSLKTQALKNIQAAIGKASKGLGEMQNAVMGVVNAASSLAKAINKTYDVMNDGENPEWMQDMEGFLSDFGEAFEMLIAPMTAVITMIMAIATVSVTATTMMTPLLIIMLSIIATAIIVAAIIAACQQHDRKLQRSIDELEETIEKTETAMKNLEALAERQSGYDKLGTSIRALTLDYKNYKDSLEQARLEEEKKNTDDKKVDEYNQKAREYLDSFLNSLKESTDEIIGSVQDWSGSLSEALRSAFQNGENAARAFKNTAIEMVGDIVNKIIEMTVLEPMIESAINGLLGYSLDEKADNYIGKQDRFKDSKGNIDPKKMADYVSTKLSNDNSAGITEFMQTIQNGYGGVMDFLNNELAKPLKEAWAYNSDTSSLSGGIQGITEDTARTLEGLSYSMLAQLVLIQRSVMNLEESGFANVQLSWFTDMLNQQRALRQAADSINSILSGSYDGVRSLRVTME